jgi:FtsP/CotA-like multicopper oxidase with cupredoxin domain
VQSSGDLQLLLEENLGEITSGNHDKQLSTPPPLTGCLVLKDVFMLGGYQEAEVDFVADNPGLTLFHCHQQLHMDLVS